MKLECQVASLELCKKLKSLGVKQESLFRWSPTQTVPKGEIYKVYFSSHSPCYSERDYSAFTVTELGEMLPTFVSDKQAESSMGLDPYTLFFMMQSKTSQKWMIKYEMMERKALLHFETDENEANARAKMLIYLLENKLIDGTL